MSSFLAVCAALLLVLAAAITYLGLQRPSLFNPPVITGLGFVVLAAALWRLRARG